MDDDIAAIHRAILAIAAEIEGGIEPRRLPRGIEIPAEAQHPDRAVGPQGGALAMVHLPFEPRVRCLERQPQHRIGRAEIALRSEEHKSELQSLMRISYAVF